MNILLLSSRIHRQHLRRSTARRGMRVIAMDSLVEGLAPPCPGRSFVQADLANRPQLIIFSPNTKLTP